MSTLPESTLETNRYELEALLSDRFVLSWRQTAVVGLVCALLVLVSFTPVAHHTTWLLASRGEAILAQGHLPETDVTQPLSQGLTSHETSWLSSIFWALVARQSLEAVSFAVSLLAGCSLVAMAMLLWRRTCNSLLTAVGMILFATMAWAALSLGSETILVLPLWIGLIALQSREAAKQPRLSDSFLTVAFIVLWANLEASVVVGVVYLSAVCFGKVVQAFVQEAGNLDAVLRRRDIRFGVTTLELAILGTLVTPLGLSLWTERFSSLAFESTPLNLASPGGLAWLLTMLGASIVLRMHSGHLRWAELLPFAAFAVACLVSGGMIAWFAPLAVLVLMPLLQFALQISPDPPAVDGEVVVESEPARAPLLKFAYTLTAVLLCWIAFAISPLSRPVLGGQPRGVSQLFDETTPVFAIRYFREHPVEGLVYAPAAWGDLLQSRQGARVNVFATTALENLPQQARFDYNRISRGENSWESAADRYHIDAFLVDKQSQRVLADAVRGDNAHWQIVHEDDLSLILRRRGA
ncbi:hypothetical protein [Blastopirellula marina]|uniref:Glycosyltransferase RgtA/B/C/D-like domain-containing protein n=1 Tax=Blastopirellula marina TaxID=124 RepID=A0A2S8GCG5_9BACT|nr:hypothetical protein [Blastopirellula marina]PQO42156.1 hypothetical protein C5Y93_27815 [Blastopirellula marina]